MAGEPVLTIIGNLTADPDLRYTNSGIAFANFTVASTPRNKNPQSGEWEEGEALFMRCTVWRDMAEHVSESVSKGARVVVYGRMRQRSYTANDGSNRTSIEMDVDEIGVSLRYATAQPVKAQPKHNPQTQGFASTQDTAPWNQPQQGWAGQPQQQGWATQQPQGNAFQQQAQNMQQPQPQWGQQPVTQQEDAPF